MSRSKTNWKLYLGAFLLPLGIAFLLCIRNGVYPFGENCILHVDMYHQYEPFFTEFMDKLKHGDSLMYSFRLGLGSDFVSLLAYYLASPLNWLLIFCPAGSVIEFMTALILLKIGLCGLTFAVYLGNRFQTSDPAVSVFAAFYALSGYMAAYSWNIMWLDVLALAPLAVLGLWKLVREGKCALYGVSLAAAVLSNYYLSFMLCIFLALWFVILLLEETYGGREKLAASGRFVLHSILAGGMGAVLILPEAAILSYSGSSGFSFPKVFEWYFDLISMLGRHCYDVAAYTGNEHWPNLYCGAAVFLFLALYFLNRTIPFKRKAGRMLLIVFFWAGFSNNMLDFFWHGLHFPDSLPGRQAYLYVFLLLVTAYEGYRRQRGNTRFHIAVSVVLSAAFLFAAAYVADSGKVTGSALLVTGILLAGYGMLLALGKMRSEGVRAFAGYLLFVLAVTEVFSNFSLTGWSVTSRKAYTKNWESVKGLLAQVEAMEEEPFYRVEEMERLTKNDAAVYGYASSTIFSSLMNIGVSRFYRLMGMEGGKNFYSYSGATPLASAMLSVKYLIADHPKEDSPLREMVLSDGQNYIYKNYYSLPLGFMADVDLEAKWDARRGEAVGNLNRLAAALGAKEDLLVPMPEAVSAGEDKTTVTAPEDCYVYATYADTSVTNLTVTHPDRERKFTKCDHGYILDLGWCRKGEPVEITNTSGVSDFFVRAYALNMDALNQAYQKLNRQTLVIKSFEDTEITGSIQVKEAGNLILSIPKEEGWRVFVDGKETECGVFMDSFFKIPLIRGEHEITLRYQTPKLFSGACVSLCCLFLFLTLCVRKRQKIQ